jgi:hypothetical protein
MACQVPRPKSGAIWVSLPELSILREIWSVSGPTNDCYQIELEPLKAAHGEEDTRHDAIHSLYGSPEYAFRVISCDSYSYMEYYLRCPNGGITTEKKKKNNVNCLFGETVVGDQYRVT